MTEIPTVAESLTMTVEETARAFGVGRDTAYASIAAGDFPLPVLHIGRRIVIPTAAVRAALMLDAITPDAAPQSKAQDDEGPTL